MGENFHELVEVEHFTNITPQIAIHTDNIMVYCYDCLAFSGDVVTQECVDKLIRTSNMLCPITGKTLKGKDLIPLQRVNIIPKYTCAVNALFVLYQCMYMYVCALCRWILKDCKCQSFFKTSRSMVGWVACCQLHHVHSTFGFP